MYLSDGSLSYDGLTQCLPIRVTTGTLAPSFWIVASRVIMVYAMPPLETKHSGKR